MTCSASGRKRGSSRRASPKQPRASIRAGERRPCADPSACQSGRTAPTQTLKDDAQLLNLIATVMGGMSVVMGAVVALSGAPAKAFLISGMFAAIAVAAFGANLIRLPRWPRLRERQVEAIAEHAVQMLSSGAQWTATADGSTIDAQVARSRPRVSVAACSAIIPGSTMNNA
jgi:hypothetical protein